MKKPIVFFACLLLLLISNQPAYAQITNVPPFGGISTCPGNPGCPSPEPSVVTGGSTNPTVSDVPQMTTLTNPVVTVAPCDNTIASDNARHSRHHRHHGAVSNFMQQILQFFFQLITMLLQLLGGGNIQVPQTPTTPEPRITIDPSLSSVPEISMEPQNPVPCPSPSEGTAPIPTAAQVSIAQPSTPQTLPSGAQSACGTGAGQAQITIDGKQAPNPLTLKNGQAVTCVADWETKRRPEILADFKESVYGQIPQTTQTFSAQSADVGNVKRKIVTVSVTGPQGSGTFPFKLFIPKTTGKPLGTFVMLNHRGASSDDPAQTGEYMPVAKITAAGYAIAVVDAGDTAPDDNGSYSSKAAKWLFGASVPDNGSKAVGIWAWSASRVMDYLQTDPDIDASKVAVIGHSRSGKASLWAGAQDTRFAAVISNNSGNTGAKFARRSNTGETVAAINSAFPHWFPQTYKAFANKEASLPVDQHELMALVAPRRVIVASATNDATSDPQGEFLSYVNAAPVYKLYGLDNTGLPSTTWPPATNKDFRGPAMSYHLRSGDHGLTNVDWDMYLNGNIFAR